MDQFNSRQGLLDTMHHLRSELDQLAAQVGEERAIQSGSFEAWSLKDLIAHLTAWRTLTAERLEAPLRQTEPTFPWPDHLSEEHNTEEINEWFYEQSRDKSLAEVMAESNATFDRVVHAIEQLPEDALLEPGRFAWVNWTDQPLGPAVVRGTHSHYYEDHKPDIDAWLASKQSA